MGRAKMAMKFITKEKVRNSTFVKRNKGLFKKARELSILCNVPICVIIYNPHKEGKQPLEPEVYSFKGDDNNANTLSSSSSNSSDMHKFAREMIDRYLRVPIEERKKRTVTLHDMLRKNRADQDDQVCATLGHDNSNVNNSDNNNDDALLLLGNNNNNNRVDSSFLDGFDHDQLVEFLGRLDQKIGYVKQRIDVIKGANLVPNQAAAASEADPDLLPYYDQPTPITSLINSAGENNQHNQMGSFHELIEGFNQVPLFNNYPMMNNNNNNDNYYTNQECYHQIVPFNNNQHSTNNNNVYTENQVGVTKFEDEEHGGGGSNNWVMYNMMGNVGPIYCDQRSGFFDNGGATSSYGPGLPMSSMAPLQMMPRLQPNNVPLPWQRQYHLPIFY